LTEKSRKYGAHGPGGRHSAVLWLNQGNSRIQLIVIARNKNKWLIQKAKKKLKKILLNLRKKYTYSCREN